MNTKPTQGHWELKIEGHHFEIEAGPSQAMKVWAKENNKDLTGMGYARSTIARGGEQYNGSGASHGPSTLITKEEVFANAKLMVESPALLRALEWALPYAEQKHRELYGDADTDNAASVLQAHAVIARIRGAS